MRRTDILEYDRNEKYKKYDDTESCFLDGRYFSVVFKNHRNVCKEPLMIFINNDELRTILPNEWGKYEIIRVVITMDKTLKHSCLLIFNGEGDVTLFNPIEDRYGDKWSLIATILQSILMLKNPSLQMYMETVDTNERANRGCIRSGFCNVHVIKRAVAHLLNKPYQPTHIKQYASMIEDNYRLPPGVPEEEENGGTSKTPPRRSSTGRGSSGGGRSSGGSSSGGTSEGTAILEGGATGAAVGAGIGALLNPVTAGGSALVGAAIGAGVGAVAGGIGDLL